MPELSVIIPVYNTEGYLRKCLDSVRNQTMRDMEIICVDDGSTDASPDILDEYARMDERIRVIHKENGGLVSARKAGLAIASGRYTGYVDSDDWIGADMYETLCRVMKESRAELVTCGYYLEGNYRTEHLDTVKEGLYRQEDMGHLREQTIYRLECRETGIRGGVWCKLFCTGLLRKIQAEIPDEISIAEDKLCVLRYILDCSSVYVLKKPLYHWVIRRSSMSHVSEAQDNDYLVRVHHVYRYLTGLYGHVNFTESMRFQAELYITELLLLGINKRMGFQNRNLLWIDPCWLDRIPLHARIVLYGGGELADTYKRQLRSRPDVTLSAVVEESRGTEEYKKETVPLEALGTFAYDYIVITIKNRGRAAYVREKLLGMKIPGEKIIWHEQPEVYWRYIEAEREPGRGQDGAGTGSGRETLQR